MTETYSRVWVDKNLSEMFPIRKVLKQGDTVSPLIFNLAFEYTIKRVQVNQDGLKLNVTHQFLAYADDVNILGGRAHTVKENVETLVVATKEIGLEVNADKTTYMVMSQDRNAERDDSVKTDNSSIKRVKEFKYLGTMLTDQNSIQEEIKSRLKLGNESPCFKPFLTGNISDKFLPTRTLLYVSVRHIFISLTSFLGIPNSMRILYKLS
jgi:hypothetical protein